MRFENSQNGYVENLTVPWLWTLLFGFLYFAVKGIWTHAVVSFALVLFIGGVTYGIGGVLIWIAYPFFAGRIVRTHYLRRGWREAI